jgi:hypothetical protein
MPEPNRLPCAYHILRYTPNLVRDEWVNIGVLLFDPAGGARRLRLIEEQEEYARVKRLHPHADEALLRALRDDFEKQFAGQNGGFRKAVETLNQTLSNALQRGPAFPPAQLQRPRDAVQPRSHPQLLQPGLPPGACLGKDR